MFFTTLTSTAMLCLVPVTAPGLGASDAMPDEVLREPAPTHEWIVRTINDQTPATACIDDDGDVEVRADGLLFWMDLHEPEQQLHMFLPLPLPGGSPATERLALVAGLNAASDHLVFMSEGDVVWVHYFVDSARVAGEEDLLGEIGFFLLSTAQAVAALDFDGITTR